MNKGYRKGVTPAIVVLILALVAIGLIIMGFPRLTGNVAFDGGELTITFPEDGLSYDLYDVEGFTWSLEGTDGNEDTCWVSRDGGANNYTLSDCASEITAAVVPYYPEDSITMDTSDANEGFFVAQLNGEVYLLEVTLVNEESNGVNTTTIEDRQDSSFTSCDDIEEFDTCEIGDITLTINDAEKVSVTNQGPINISINEGGKLYRFDADPAGNVLIPIEGENTWTLYMTDTSANEVEVSTTFTVLEPVPPEPGMFAGDVPEDEAVSISYPVEGEDYTAEVPSILEYSLHGDIDVANDLIKCEYNDGVTLLNHQFSCTAPISIPPIEGENTWSISLYDKFGNEATKAVTFTYSPEFTAPYSWKAVGGSSSRDRFANVQIYYTNATDKYLIQPSVYGDFITGTDGDYLFTSKGYAYAVSEITDGETCYTVSSQNLYLECTAECINLPPSERGTCYVDCSNILTSGKTEERCGTGNHLLKISIETGLVDSRLRLPDTGEKNFLINGGRDLIYAFGVDKIQVINASGMVVIDELTPPRSLTPKINPVMKGNKIFSSTVNIMSLEVFDLVSPYDIEHSTSLNGLGSKVGITEIAGTDLITFISVDDQLHVLNTIPNADDTYNSNAINASCANPLSDIISRGNKLYYMCNESDVGILVDVTVNTSDMTMEKTMYGGPGVSRLKNSHKPAFALSNQWIYYGIDNGITAVLLNNLGAGDIVAGNPITNTIGEVVSMIVSTDTVYAINTVGTLYALNASDVSQEFWRKDLDVVGAGPNLFNILFAKNDRVLVLGKDNLLYKFPKTGAEITLVINESKEWVIGAGNKQRTRHYDTAGIGGTGYKILSFNPLLDGQILMNKDKDNVLVYEGKAYALTIEGDINKISLTTGRIEESTEADLGITQFMIDSTSKAIFASGGQFVRKILTNTFDMESKDVISSDSGNQDTDWTCECYNQWSRHQALEHQTPGFFILGQKAYSFLMDQKYHYYREVDRDKWGGCGCGSRHRAYAYIPKTNVYLVQIGTAFDYLYKRSPYMDMGRLTLGEWDASGNGGFPRKDSRLATKSQAKVKGVTHVDGTNNIAISVYGKIQIFNTETDTSEKIIDITDGCELVTEIISKGDILYFICREDTIDKFKRVSISEETTIQLTLPAQINSRNTFAMLGDVILYGGIDGSLHSIDTAASPLQMTAGLLTNGEDENINTITAVNDLIYVGTEKGFIYALDADLTEVWSEDVTNGLGPITSIVIPAENSMLAIGGINDLYLFGESLEGIIPGCGNGVCDSNAGETYASCPSECPDPDAEQGHSGSDEDHSRSDPSTNCKRTYDGQSLWRDSEENSENYCLKDGEKCCPNFQTCTEFDDDTWKCIFDGQTSSCGSYTTPEDCADYESWVAFESVNLNQGPGFCGSVPETGSYYGCKCFWDTAKSECAAGFEKREIQDDGSEVVTESCELSCDDGQCIGGIKTVSCSAVGGPAGVCSGTSSQTGCDIPTEVPFFTLINGLVALGILAGFYILTRKR